MHQVAALGHVGAVAHRISRPTGPPGNASPCGLEPFIFATRSANLYFRRRRRGRIVSTPSVVSNSTSVPFSSCTCSATDLGIRIPRLLPHFCTVVDIVTSCIYDEYTYRL